MLILSCILDQILTEVLSMKVFHQIAVILRCYQTAVFHADYIFKNHYLISLGSSCCLVLFFLPPLLTSIDTSLLFVLSEYD